MAAGRAASVAVAALLLAGCGGQDAPPPPPACTGDPGAIARALQTAPARVRLGGGLALSGCLRRARTDADLQNVGSAFTGVAEDLEEQALAGDAEAALQLGYLVGAAQRGAETTGGVGAELVRRLERSGAAVDAAVPEAAAALRRGLRAGAERG